MVSSLTTERFVPLGQKEKDWLSSVISYSITVFKDSLFLAVIELDSQAIRIQGRILRYNPQADHWQELYIAPLVQENTTSDTPKLSQILLGSIYSEMTVLPGQTDGYSTLYVSLISPFEGQVLRSEDGETFVSLTPAAVKSIASLGLQQLFPWQNQVYALASWQQTKETADKKDAACVYVSSHSGLETWEKVSLPGFEDRNNVALSALATLKDSLYVGTVNENQGFQIWTAPSQNHQSPYQWQNAIANGAYRYTLSQLVSAMLVFQDKLYVASGITPAFGQDSDEEFYTPVPEITRFYADNSWDLIVGTPKFTPDGLKVPLSGMGAGFDNAKVMAFSCLTVHQGHCYVVAQEQNKFQLWATADGETWEPMIGEKMTASGAAISTPFGLVLVVETPQSAANSLLPPNATKRIEVWLGK